MATDSSLSGRKIFFLCLPLWVVEDFKDELIQMEYEVYHHPDHKAISKIVSMYPESILFINLDSTVKESEWDRLIRALLPKIQENDIAVGVMSSDHSKSLVEKYVLEFKCQAGFISMRQGTRKISQKIVQLIQALKARGRRRYVRASCAFDKRGRFNLQKDGRYGKGIILDISSAGMACQLEESDESNVKLSKNEALDDIQLRLGPKITSISATVVGVRQDVRPVYVMIFDPKTGSAVKAKVYEFIKQTLQDAFLKQIPDKR